MAVMSIVPAWVTLNCTRLVPMGIAFSFSNKPLCWTGRTVAQVNHVRRIFLDVSSLDVTTRVDLHRDTPHDVSSVNPFNAVPQD